MLKCPNCKIDIADSAKKCPFCKEPVGGEASEKFRNFNFKYTITSKEQIKIIRDTVSELSERVAADSAKNPQPQKSKRKFVLKRKAKSAAANPSKRSVKAVPPVGTAGGVLPKNAASKDALTNNTAAIGALTDKAAAIGNLTENTAQSGTFAGSAATGGTLTENTAAKSLSTQNTKAANTSAAADAAASAVTNAKPLDKSKKLRLGIAALMLAAILIVAGIVSLAVGLITSRDVSYSTYVYSKGNELYAVCNGKSTKLSSDAVDEGYLTKMSVYANKVSAAEVLNGARTYKISQNGRYIYYLESFNPDKACGDLYRVEKSNPDSRIKIAAAVNGSVELSARGDKILFLCSADENGNMGALYFWEKGLREPYKITTDIDSGTFLFSKDGKKAMFIQNLDREIMQGDLYTKNLEKLKDEKMQLDSGVCRVFGTSFDSKLYIYGKSYDVSDKSFEIFSIGGKNGLLQMSEKTYSAPVICKKSNNVFVIDADSDGTGTLYKSAIAAAKREKIASGVSSVQRLSDDEKTLLFDKVFDGKTADCYTYTKGKQPEKVAENITVDYDTVHDTPQFGYTDDLKTFVYISDYSEERGGTLFRTAVSRGRAKPAQKLAEGVHSCYIGDSGRIIYTKDYNAERGTADVYSVNGGKTLLLKNEVSPLMFAPAADCGKIFCITDYNAGSASGSLESVDGKANTEVLDKDVFGLDISASGDIFYYKTLDAKNGGSFDLWLLRGGKNAALEVGNGVQTFAVK